MNSPHLRLAHSDHGAFEPADVLSLPAVQNQDRIVLLVEESSDHAVLFETAWLRQPDAPELIRVRDGEEAKEFLLAVGRFKSRKGGPLPSLIISDLKMPICGGLELLKWQGQQPQVRQLPFVMLSSSAAEQDVRDAYAAGVDSYIVRATRFSQFREILAYLRCFWSNQSPVIENPLATAV